MLVVLFLFLSFGEQAEQGPSVQATNSSLRHQSCPRVLQEISSNEEKRRFFLSARKGQCIEQIRGPLENLEGKADFDSAHDAYEAFQSMYGDLGRGVHQSALACSRLNNQSEAKYLVSKQYYSMLRLENYQKQVALQLKSIKNISGDKENLICLGTGGLRSFCNDLNSSCENEEAGFDELLEETNQVMALKQNMQRELRGYRSKIHGSGLSREERDKAKDIQDAMKIIEEAYPWINDSDFKRSIRKREGVEDALKKYLKGTKDKLEEKFHQNSVAMGCLKNSLRGSNCDSDKIKNLINESPNLQSYRYGDRDKNLAATYLDIQSCSVEATRDQEETANILRDTAIGAGLTLVPGGFALRSVLASTKGSASMSGAARAALTAGRGQNLSKVERISRSGIYLSDSVWAVYHADKAAEECGPYLSALQDVKEEEELTCPAFGKESANVERGHAMCLAKSLLMGAAPAMPALARLKLPSSIRDPYQNVAKGNNNLRALAHSSQLSDAQRVETASRLLGRNLSREQRQALLRAHNVEAGNISEKARILRDAGFSRSERNRLIRGGITGDASMLKMKSSELEQVSAKAFREGDIQLAQRKSNEAAEAMEEYYRRTSRQASGRDAEELANLHMQGGNHDKAAEYFIRSYEPQDLNRFYQETRSSYLSTIKKNSDSTVGEVYTQKLRDLRRTMEEVASSSDFKTNDSIRRSLRQCNGCPD